MTTDRLEVIKSGAESKESWEDIGFFLYSNWRDSHLKWLLSEIERLRAENADLRAEASG